MKRAALNHTILNENETLGDSERLCSTLCSNQAGKIINLPGLASCFQIGLVYSLCLPLGVVTPQLCSTSLVG